MTDIAELPDARLPPIDGDTVTDGKFWLVVCTDAREVSGGEMLTRGYKFLHDTEASAAKEAARLAKLHRNYEFAVVESVASVRFDERESRLRWQESELPAWRRPVAPC